MKPDIGLGLATIPPIPQHPPLRRLSERDISHPTPKHPTSIPLKDVLISARCPDTTPQPTCIGVGRTTFTNQGNWVHGHLGILG